jgi:hypothetical protein
VKRLLIVVVIAVMLTAAFAVPVFADKPADPGGFGTAMAFHNAQGSLGPGASYEIQMAKDVYVNGFKNLGQVAKWFLWEDWGIPPGHTP